MPQFFFMLMHYQVSVWGRLSANVLDVHLFTQKSRLDKNMPTQNKWQESTEEKKTCSLYNILVDYEKVTWQNLQKGSVDQIFSDCCGFRFSLELKTWIHNKRTCFEFTFSFHSHSFNLLTSRGFCQINHKFSVWK